MIVSNEYSTNTINIYNNILQFSNIYSKHINSINLHTSSFDNASHDDKPSRISHNSITLCHEQQDRLIWLFRGLISKYQS